ncbi:hypothetical protein OHV05_24415 [Kitasatospora sp. NBC_00070]|uniref:hypothetical protein n=1 Tax=Kitasatospora sp. NBC_00070 TaxID=2975962 RepID=UPI00324BD17F
MVATDPLWLPSTTYDEAEFRAFDLELLMADGTARGARPGVRPGDPGLAVSLAGTTVNVSGGVAALCRSGQGVYRAQLAATSPGTLTAAHATLGRIDLVYLRVWDTAVDASGFRKADTVYLAGTPSGSPAAPTPGGTEIYIPLATITVPSSAGGGTGAATVSSVARQVTVAPGGILPVSSTADLAISGVYVGQCRYNTVRGCPEYWSGSAWVAQGDYQAYTPTWTTSGSAPTVGNATFAARWTRVGKQVTYAGNFTVGSTTSVGTGLWRFSLPVASAAAIYVRGAGSYVNPGDNEYLGASTVDPSGTTLSVQVKTQTTYFSGTVANNVPVAPSTGVIVTWNLTYEGV